MQATQEGSQRSVSKLSPAQPRPTQLSSRGRPFHIGGFHIVHLWVGYVYSRRLYRGVIWTRCLLLLAVYKPKLIWSVTPLCTLLAFLEIKFVHCAWKKSKNTVESLTTITSRIRQLFTKPEMTAAAHETYYWKRFFGKWDLSVANYYLGSFFKSRQKTDKFWWFLFFLFSIYNSSPDLFKGGVLEFKKRSLS